jgi:Family of unknown function (DUF5681)
MSIEPSPVNTGEKQVMRLGGRFAKGSSGNSQGKPRGARHRYSRLAEAMLEGEAEGLIRKLVELALAGDVAALKICVDRIVPTHRRPVNFKVQIPDDNEGLMHTFDQILKAVANGEVTPDEAATIAGIIESRCRVVEHVELIGRIEALEALM